MEEDYFCKGGKPPMTEDIVRLSVGGEINLEEYPDWQKQPPRFFET